ncbi:MAG: putative DNA binding domain-containing protein [Candidatus Competibacteraceae bacterium]
MALIKGFSADYTAEILALIRQSENSSAEFKSANAHPDSLAMELVAFANTQGGILLIGVEDDGSISGLTESTDHEARIANIARNNVNPPINIESTIVSMPEGRILMVKVDRGRDRPYQTLQNQFLVRVGSTNRTATQGELLRLFQQAGLFHYDATAVHGTGIADLNLAALDRHFSQYGFDLTAEEDKPRILANADVMTETGETTVAGLLLFGINPQRYLSYAGISFAHFAGDQVTEELIDKQVIEGVLGFQVDSALAVIRNNLRRPSRIQGPRAEDTHFQYPDKVFRELLVNALVHRNYAITGSRIRIQMFADRIEFISPGRLPNSVNIAKLPMGVSYAVNPIIVKFMENMRYMDRLGRGLPMVWQTARKNQREVRFQEIGEEFQVTLGR